MTHAGLGYSAGQTGWPVETTGGTVLVSKLRGSQMHKVCIDLYQRHRPSGSGICLSCEAPVPCRPRCNAAKVIQAAGEDPARYDAQIGEDSGLGRDRADDGSQPASPGGAGSQNVVGWSLGRGVRVASNYER